jgi:amidohydrolase
VAAAAQFITAAYGLVPRSVDNRESLVLTFAAIHGGIVPNVIPDEVTILGTMRSLDAAARDRAMDRLQAIARAIGSATDTEIQLTVPMHVPGVVCDQSLVELVWAACERVVGAEQVQSIPKPSMGGEDFANYLQRVPGVMARVGCSATLDSLTPLHSSHFDVDEAVIGIAAKVLALSALEWHASQQGRFAVT